MINMGWASDAFWHDLDPRRVRAEGLMWECPPDDPCIAWTEEDDENWEMSCMLGVPVSFFVNQDIQAERQYNSNPKHQLIVNEKFDNFPKGKVDF